MLPQADGAGAKLPRLPVMLEAKQCVAVLAQRVGVAFAFRNLGGFKSVLNDVVAAAPCKRFLDSTFRFPPCEARGVRARRFLDPSTPKGHVVLREAKTMNADPTQSRRPGGHCSAQRGGICMTAHRPVTPGMVLMGSVHIFARPKEAYYALGGGSRRTR